MSRHLDDLLNIANPYFEGMVKQIYSTELHLNKAITPDTEAPFGTLICLFLATFFTSKSYNERDDFDFDLVKFLFLDGDIPSHPSHEASILQPVMYYSK